MLRTIALKLIRDAVQFVDMMGLGKLALSIYLTLLDWGDIESGFRAGVILYYGHNVTPDGNRATTLILQAAANGSLSARSFINKLKSQGIDLSDTNHVVNDQVFSHINEIGKSMYPIAFLKAVVELFLVFGLVFGVRYLLSK